MDEQPPPPANQSTWDATKTWVSNNKLKTIFGIWAGGIGATLLYEWTKPSSVSLKIIHARVVAQALTLACLAGAAGADYLEHRSSTTNVCLVSRVYNIVSHRVPQQELEVAKQRIIELEQKMERTFLGKK